VGGQLESCRRRWRDGAGEAKTLHRHAYALGAVTGVHVRASPLHRLRGLLGGPPGAINAENGS
jgi:hypothetical protein